MTAETIIAAPALLRDGRIGGPGALAVARGRIRRVLDEVPKDADVVLPCGVVTPGLIDLHNNGAFGVDFAVARGSDWRRVLAGLAARGVTAVQPTIITAPLAAIRDAMERVALAATAATSRAMPEARILGVHLEGPFIAEARRGAHRAEWVRTPDPEAIDLLLGHLPSRQMLRTMTLAPELAHALGATARLAAAGVVVSIGHSDATAEQAAAAIEAGARMVTHLFNAMRPFAHRDPGLSGAALTDSRLFLGLIVDGHHVHPIGCRLAFQAAASRIVAVTDSILIAGMPPGTEMEFGGAKVVVDDDGVGRRPDGTLAGAGIILDEGVRRMIATGLDPAMVLTSATTTAARAIQRQDLGRLAVGARADLVWWDEEWQVLRVWIGGREVGAAHCGIDGRSRAVRS
ncbi:MAG: N-acetylglucosamine-6-phosphate deacetylase [Acetobacteraceae bacterium]